MNKIILLEDVKKGVDFQVYQCANIEEKTFICSTELIYRLPKYAKFGSNYRYCSNCYNKWNKLEKEKQVNKYYISKKIDNIDFLD
jgi:hypothetical protein